MWKISKDYTLSDNYLLNNKTGKLYQLTEEQVNCLKRPSPDKMKELNLSSDIICQNKLEKEKGSFYLQWHITNVCNLRCRHCYDWKLNPRTLPLEELKYIVDEYVNFIKILGMQGHIALTGGEITTVPYLIDLIEYIKNHDVYIKFDLMTNGTMIPQELVEKIVQYNINVQVSLDGLEKNHDLMRGKGNFSKTINNIKILIKKGVKVSTHYVLTKENSDIKLLENYINTLDSLGVSHLTFSPLVPIGVGESLKIPTQQQMKEILSFLIQKNKNTKCNLINCRPLWALVGGSGACSIGKSSLTIDEKGDILACRRLPIKLGNIFTDKLIKIWLFDDFLKKIRNNNLKGKCQSCPHINKCGGCRALALAVNKDVFSEDPLCWK
ncbi:MAG: radical SAM protein [Alphaproteobacteria bacterium]